MDFSFFELFCVAVLAVVVLGPKDLVRYAHIAGNYWGRFRSYANNLRILAQEEYLMSEAIKNKESSDAPTNTSHEDNKGA